MNTDDRVFIVALMVVSFLVIWAVLGVRFVDAVAEWWAR